MENSASTRIHGCPDFYADFYGLLFYDWSNALFREKSDTRACTVAESQFDLTRHDELQVAEIRSQKPGSAWHRISGRDLRSPGGIKILKNPVLVIQLYTGVMFPVEFAKYKLIIVVHIVSVMQTTAEFHLLPGA